MSGIDGLAALSEGFCPLGHGRMNPAPMEDGFARVGRCEGCDCGWARHDLFGPITGAVNLRTRCAWFASDDLIRLALPGQAWVFSAMREAALAGHTDIVGFGQWEPMEV
jgi:hypothetical protein